MTRHLNVPTVVLGTVVVALMVALGGLLWMMQTGVGETHTVAIDVATSTSEATSPTASDIGVDASSGTGNEPVPVTVKGALLPDGVPVDATPVDFSGWGHSMKLTIDGITQHGDCTVVLMRVTPAEDFSSFDLPQVGLVSGGKLYQGGGCDTTGLADAGYPSSNDVQIAAGETGTFFEYAQKAGGTLADVEAITVEVADGKYLFFAPTEKKLS